MKLKQCISILLSVLLLTTVLVPTTVSAESQGIMVSDCDSTSGWSNYPGDGIALDTSEKSQGTGSIKLWQTGGFCALYKLSDAMDISDMKYFTFDMKPQAADWFEKAGYAYLVVSSRQDGGGYDEPDNPAWNENALLIPLSGVKLHEGWNTVNVALDFSKANEGFNPEKVTKVGIFGLRYYERDGENVNYIDNVRFGTVEGAEAEVVDPLVSSTKKLIDKAAGIYEAGNTAYTQGSFDKFASAYEAVKDVDLASVTKDELISARKTLQSGLNTLTAKTNVNALEENYKRVIVVGIDGLGAFDADVDTPNLDRIRSGDDVLYTHTATSVVPSISAQNWSAMLLGVSPQRHGNTNESIEANETPDYQTYPSIFKYIRNTYPEATMGSIVNWSPINYGVIEHNIGVDLQTNSSDDEIANTAVKYWTENDPIMTFLHFDSVDHEGHSTGYQKEKYYEALKNVDRDVGVVYDALESLGYLDDTLFVILTDHGGVGTNHGGTSAKEMNCTYIAKGKSVVPGEYTNEATNNVLTTASISSVTAAALGIAQSGDYDYTVPDNYFKGYTYSAPENNEWQVETPGKDYRNHKTFDNSDDKVKLSDYIDAGELGLKAYFKFDGDLKNSRPTVITAKEKGSVTFDDNGYYGGAADLSDGYLTVDGLKNLGTDSFTLSFWVKDLDASSGDPALVSNKDWESGMNPGMTIASENGKFRLNLADGSSRSDTPYTSANGYTTSGSGGFVNIIAVVDRVNSIANLYADFRLIGTTGIDVGSLDSAVGTTFVIGSDGKGEGLKAKFKIDELMYFASALGSDDVAKLKAYYDAGNETPDADTATKALEKVNEAYNLIKSIGEVTADNWAQKTAPIEAAAKALAELKEECGNRRVDNIALYNKAVEDYEKYKVDILFGDVNMNGSVEVSDALLTLQHAVGKIVLEGNALTAAKVSDDGNAVSVTDALLILQKSVGKIDKFPIEK